MSKRVSGREMALLTAPVLVIGALGWWVSIRPAPLDTNKPYLSFQLEKPTVLEAFRGADASCVVTINNLSSFDSGRWQMSPYIELKTPYGTEVGRQYGNYDLDWKRNLWNYTSRGASYKHFLLKTAAIPDGEMRFGVDGVVPPNTGIVPLSSPDLRNKPLRLSGHWKIDRTTIKGLNLAAWPRKPLISLRAFRILTTQSAQPGFAAVITGEAIFQLDSTIVTNAPLQMSLSASNGSSNHSRQVGSEPPHFRLAAWTLFISSDPKVHITGRVSANNRWPLGFDIEPFDFNTVKNGQKLKLGSFPSRCRNKRQINNPSCHLCQRINSPQSGAKPAFAGCQLARFLTA